MEGFVEVLGRFAELAICAAISSVPLCLIVGVISLVSRRLLSARALFALWTLVLVRMILPVSVETPFGLGMFINYLPKNTSNSNVALKNLSLEMSLPDITQPVNEYLYPANVAVPPIPSWLDLRWEYLVLTIATCGIPGISLLIATWFLITSTRTSRRIGQATIPQNPAWDELLDRGRRQFGIRAPVQLRIVQNWTTPATTGFFRPLIILPDDASSLSEEELQHVVWHELAHIKRGDAAWNYLWIVARCVQWWNPCFWLTQHCWLAERELACDAQAMKHLGSSAASGYGRTLIHFLERLSQSSSSLQSIPLSGLVMLLGDKLTIRRRLKALARPLAIETFWGRWSSLGLLTLLAMTGLTDAAASKTESPSLKSVTVPLGTVWQFGPETNSDVEAAQLPSTTRTYDVSAALARIQKVAPGASSEIDIRLMIQGDTNIFPRINGKPQTEQCQIQGNELTVNATESQHQRIQNLLDHWQQFGQQQIVTEVRLISTELELSDFMPATGGQIISPSPFRDKNLGAPLQSAHEINHLLSGPSYVRILSPDERDTTMHRLQDDPQSSILYAPKLTMFSLCTGIVSLGTQRPFVTGLRTKQDGTREPQISTVTEGVQIGLAPAVADVHGAVKLDIHIRHSRLLDVESFWTKVAHQPDEIGIQIPHVSESNLKTSVTLANDEGILVCPLRRDKQGKLQIFIITPRAIEVP